MAAAKKTVKSAAPSMFETATVVSAPKKPKAGKPDNRERVAIGGLEDYAVLCAAMDNLKALKETVEVGVKAQMRAYFVDKGGKLEKRPDNFRGVERTASASCELRKRGDNSPLSEEDIKILTKAGISTKEVEIVPERFIINPAYADNQDILAAVSAALQGVKGVPADLFQKQAREIKTCVPEEAMDELFKLKPAALDQVFDKVSVLAVKPKLEENTDFAEIISAALAIVKAGDEAANADPE